MVRRPQLSCALHSRSTCASSSSFRRQSLSSAAIRSSARWARSSSRHPDVMYYELALISVLVAGGYWGWYFARHHQTRIYGDVQLGAAALSGLGLIGSRL